MTAWVDLFDVAESSTPSLLDMVISQITCSSFVEEETISQMSLTLEFLTCFSMHSSKLHVLFFIYHDEDLSHEQVVG